MFLAVLLKNRKNFSSQLYIFACHSHRVNVECTISFNHLHFVLRFFSHHTNWLSKLIVVAVCVCVCVREVTQTVDW